MNVTEISCPAQILSLLEQLGDVEIHGKYFMVVTFMTVNVILSLSATLGNGLLIYTILRSQDLQTPSYLLITSLAFTNLLVGVLWHPLQIAFIAYYLQNNIRGLCGIVSLYVFVLTLVAGISMMMVTCLSIDRYLALSLKHRYKIVVTRKRVRVFIVMVWLTGLAWAIFLQFDLWSSTSNLLRLFFPFFVILLMISITCYTKSYRTLHIYTRQVHSGEEPSHLPSSYGFNVARYKKTLKTMLLLLASLLLSFFPAVCAVLARIVFGFRHEMVFLYFASLMLWGIDSSTNPVVYLVRLADIRQAFKEALRHFFACVRQRCTRCLSNTTQM